MSFYPFNPSIKLQRNPYKDYSIIKETGQLEIHSNPKHKNPHAGLPIDLAWESFDRGFL
jgi:hypothetical protein